MPSIRVLRGWQYVRDCDGHWQQAAVVRDASGWTISGAATRRDIATGIIKQMMRERSSPPTPPAAPTPVPIPAGLHEQSRENLPKLRVVSGITSSITFVDVPMFPDMPPGGTGAGGQTASG